MLLPATIAPGAWPRRCLLMTVGKTPQVVTETFHALATRAASERFIPTEVHLITTAEGRRQAEIWLLDDGRAMLAALCAELELDRQAIRFGRDTIHVVCDAVGRPLEDIRTVADNHAMADAIVGRVRELTADADCALHVSLAGGRKTMGFYLGYALSLFGRPQDRLSHVLVDARLERLPGFFFPSRHDPGSAGDDGALGTGPAAIELADIPVVSLRGLLGAELLGDDSASYADIVRRARSQVDPSPRLEISLCRLRVRAGRESVAMKPAEAVWYAFFASRTAAGKPGIGWRNRDSAAAAAELRAFARQLESHNPGIDEDICSPWITADGQVDFAAADRLRTRVNQRLRHVLGPGPAAPYLIRREGGRGNSLYRIALEPGSIILTKT